MFNFFGSFGKGLYQNESLSSYYNYKNKAELDIIDDNFLSALENYNYAFKYKVPFEIDLYNAFIVSVKIQNKVMAYKYANLLATHGLKKQMLKSRIKALLNNASFSKTIFKDYDNYYQEFENGSKKMNAKDLFEIYERDQRIRQLNIPISTESVDFIRDSINALIQFNDSVNIIELKKYITNFGFPGFELVGYADPFRPNPYMGSTVYSLWWHNRSEAKVTQSIIELRKIGIEAVKSGDFLNSDYAFLFDLNEDQYPYYFQFISLDIIDSNFVFKTIPISEGILNRRRAEIYLEPIEDYKRKIEFMAHNKTFYFYTFNAVATILTQFHKY